MCFLCFFFPIARLWIFSKHFQMFFANSQTTFFSCTLFRPWWFLGDIITPWPYGSKYLLRRYKLPPNCTRKRAFPVHSDPWIHRVINPINFESSEKPEKNSTIKAAKKNTHTHTHTHTRFVVFGGLFGVIIHYPVIWGFFISHYKESV